MSGLAGLNSLNRAHSALAHVAGALLMLAALLLPGAALAQQFPALSGRVVDAANVIPPDVEARLTQKLTLLETQSKRQLVVATIPDLQGYDIADYGYQLGRAWGIGSKEKNDGALLIIAPNERKLRIEVGYGLEGVLTDGLSSLIINQTIVPQFKAGNMPAGIEAGTDAIIHQLTLPPDQAQQIAAQANRPRPAEGGGIPIGTIIWIGFIFFFFILPLFRRRRGRHYDSGLGQVILWNALDGLSRGSGSGGGGWSSGGGSDWGGGGFSGGGGSFGGGGSSGSW